MDLNYMFTWPYKDKAIRESEVKTSKRLMALSNRKARNYCIKADNLDALKILKERYPRSIKCIYIDPPYNTGKTFAYSDNFKSCHYSDLFSRNHASYLNFMYPRLKLAFSLLTEDGCIFISIDDREYANLKLVMDEIFGESNHVGTIIHQRSKGGGKTKFIIRGHDYILVYAKCISKLKLQKRTDIPPSNIITKNGKSFLINDDYIRKVYGKYDNKMDRRCFYEEIEEYHSKAKKLDIDAKIKNGQLFLKKNKFGMHTICELKPIEACYSKLYSIIRAFTSDANSELESLGISGFQYSKPVSLIKTLIDASTESDRNHIVLDFFGGSFTTGQAVMELNKEDNGNRRFILIQDDSKVKGSDKYESIFDLGLARLQKASRKTGIPLDVKTFYVK